MQMEPTGQTLAHFRQRYKNSYSPVSSVHDYLRVFAAEFKVKGVDAFDLVADSYAPRAYDAPVSVDNKEIMG
jgi:hypothetical protein